MDAARVPSVAHPLCVRFELLTPLLCWPRDASYARTTSKRYFTLLNEDTSKQTVHSDGPALELYSARAARRQRHNATRE